MEVLQSSSHAEPGALFSKEDERPDVLTQYPVASGVQCRRRPVSRGHVRSAILALICGSCWLLICSVVFLGNEDLLLQIFRPWSSRRQEAFENRSSDVSPRVVKPVTTQLADSTRKCVLDLVCTWPC